MMASADQSLESPVEGKYYKNEGNPEVLRWVPADAREILDLGCGAGDNASALSWRGLGVDGVTLSEEEASAARRVCRTVVVHNLEKGLPAELANSYDAVLASHVLEHICFPSPLLSDVRARLTPGGVFIVALPNLLHWRYRLRLFRGKFEYEPSGIMDNTHFRWYTFASASRLLRQNGFEVVRAYADGLFPFFVLRRFVPAGIEKLMNSWICALFPGLFGLQLLYVARKSA